ncbi:hypothetical protein N9P25_01950 [Flavobacteriaceae bacterium]|nr:hypothetical protein [Flavobacteriaceae bacterium]
MNNLKSNIKKEVLITLKGIKIDTQEIKNQISFGCQSEENELKDFNFERLQANDVYLLAEMLADQSRRLNMLLGLLK